VLNFSFNSNVNSGGDVTLVGLIPDQALFNFTTSGKNVGLNKKASSYPLPLAFQSSRRRTMRFRSPTPTSTGVSSGAIPPTCRSSRAIRLMHPLLRSPYPSPPQWCCCPRHWR